MWVASSKKFYHMVYTQYSPPIKVLRSDNDDEYLNQDLSHFIFTKRAFFMKLHVLKPHNKIELPNEKNWHVLKITCALLIGSCAPKLYWANAATYAIYIMN